MKISARNAMLRKKLHVLVTPKFNPLFLSIICRPSSFGTFLCILSFVLASCAYSPTIQPKVNSYVLAGRYDYALRLLEEHPEYYADRNRLLYLMDYGMVLHLSGRYEESINILNQAKDLYDRLYTVSLSRESLTWLVNDNTSPYRGEDFERVMINVIQALNFVLAGNLEGALVEARDVNNRLRLINLQYGEELQNVYDEDAFARFFSGVLYETRGFASDLDDALIEYKRALKIYEEDYRKHYGLGVPEALVENLLRLTHIRDPDFFRELKSRYPDVDFPTIREKQENGEIYVIHYAGYSPVKQASSVPIPLPGGYFTKLAFPLYEKRRYRDDSRDIAVESSAGRKVQVRTEPVQPIDEIAVENLENRRLRVIAKASVRVFGKYMAEKTIENSLRRKHGDTTSDVFRYVSSLYNIASEQPDLRSWQTLPAEIHLARIVVEPGRYDISMGPNKLGTVDVKKGGTAFLVAKPGRPYTPKPSDIPVEK